MNSPRSSSTPSPAYGSSTVFWHARRARPGAGGVSVRVLGLALAGGGATSLALAPSCTEFIGCEKVRKCPADGGMGGELSSSGGMTSGGSLSGGFAGETSTGGAAPTGKPSTGGQQGTGGAPPPPECEGITCQDDASCTLDDGEPVCECNTGFEADGDACTDVNECEDDPCGEGGECENETGGYSCSCAPGFYEDLGACWPDMVLVSAVGENLGVSEACRRPEISDDGRYVAFLCPGSQFGFPSTSESDLLLRDLHTGTIELVNVNLQGQPSGSVSNFSLSGDGAVAFDSTAADLVPGDTNNVSDVFLRTSKGVTRVSVSSSGIQSDGSSGGPSLSAEGKFLLFHSNATNLLAGATTNGFFTKSLESGGVVLLPTTGLGPVDMPLCRAPILSRRGEHAVFGCDNPNTMLSSFAYRHLYVHDLQAQTSELANVGSTPGQAGNQSVTEHTVSDDGRFVVFASSASDLVPNDANSNHDVFVRDIVEGTSACASVTSAGLPGNGYSNLGGGRSSISADGRYIAFESTATDLIPDDSNGRRDVFVRDRLNSTTRIVSRGPDGQEADEDSHSGTLSADGRFAVFLSSATILGAETNGADQVWKRRILP